MLNLQNLYIDDQTYRCDFENKCGYQSCRTQILIFCSIFDIDFLNQLSTMKSQMHEILDSTDHVGVSICYGELSPKLCNNFDVYDFPTFIVKKNGLEVLRIEDPDFIVDIEDITNRICEICLLCSSELNRLLNEKVYFQCDDGGSTWNS